MDGAGMFHCGHTEPPGGGWSVEAYHIALHTISVLKLGITEADLQHMFEQFWSVTEIKVITDRETGQPRGSAFVTMSVVKELIARAIHKRSLSNAAKKHLEKLGVEVRLNHAVDKIDGEGVIVNGERIASKTVIWTAGVAPSPAGKRLGVQTDRAGRVRVQNDLPVPDHPEIFVIDDTPRLIRTQSHYLALPR